MAGPNAFICGVAGIGSSPSAGDDSGLEFSHIWDVTASASVNGWLINADWRSEAGVTTAQILIGFGADYPAGRRLTGAGQPAAHSRAHRAPAGRFHRGRRLTGDVNPQHCLGASFQPLVSLSVAVILYDAGLGLDPPQAEGSHPQGGDPP